MYKTMSGGNRMKKFFKGDGITSTVCVAWSIYQIYSSAFAMLNPYLRYSIHLCFAMVLVWLLYPVTTKSKSVTKIIKVVLPLLSVCVFGYVGWNYQEISERIPRVTPLSDTEIVLAVIAVILLIEATRRSIGVPLAAVCAFFLLYAYFGKYIPGGLGHGGYSIETILDYVYFSSEGIWGLSLRISATYLFLFILYAEIIKECGVGDFFMALASGLAGGLRGGPAQIGVLGSCLFGMISGSAVANVYAVGAFTIPMMKKIGYEPAFAGAVEAYASTGGQLMPPIMAATAFVMAEFMGVSYWAVCIMAFVPALLYYFCGGAQIFFEAHKRNLKAIPKEERPRLVDTLKKGWHQTIPIVALLAGLAMGFSEERTVLWSMLIAIVVSFFRRETRMTPARLIHALDQAARSAVMIAVSCAAVGVVLAIFVIGGLGVSLTQMIFKLGAGIPILTALLIAGVCFILGMGMPTLPAYVITAALGVPVLTTVGFRVEAAHIYVLYYSVLSMITPPVAMAAYAAATLAKADPWIIGWKAVRLGLGGFLVPIFVLYFPALLMKGSLLQIGDAVLGTAFAFTLLAAAVAGHFRGPIAYWERLLLLAGFASFLLVGPGVGKLFGLLIVALLLRQLIWAQLFKKKAAVVINK
jgi:TRAP transporter 4TM/12TM fusion protein